MATHREAVALAVRKIIADYFDRSLAGTREHVRFAGDLAVDGDRAAELRHRVANELGVDVPEREWLSFRTVDAAITFVDLQIQREYARSD